jgi:SAM-dependent methyltransferase
VPEPVLDTNYWKLRLDAAGTERHRSVFICPPPRWKLIEARHRMILKTTIKPEESILDAGCGYGRLLNLMPAEWRGKYLGIDVSPHFVDLAQQEHPKHTFWIGKLEHRLNELAPESFDWAVLISIKHMLIRNVSSTYWDALELQLKRVARRLLFLEYDPHDGGSVV